jgi:hypothetical protein
MNAAGAHTVAGSAQRCLAAQEIGAGRRSTARRSRRRSPGCRRGPPQQDAGRCVAQTRWVAMRRSSRAPCGLTGRHGGGRGHGAATLLGNRTGSSTPDTTMSGLGGDRSSAVGTALAESGQEESFSACLYWALPRPLPANTETCTFRVSPSASQRPDPSDLRAPTRHCLIARLDARRDRARLSWNSRKSRTAPSGRGKSGS